MFIGQRHIFKELNVLLSSGDNYNLLLIGQPGQGKTLLGLKIASYLGDRFTYKIANADDEFFNRILNGADVHRLIFIDEIHRLGYEVERIYPLLDAHNNFFIFATNQPHLLPEAFRTRLIELLFARYSQEELRDIVRGYLVFELGEELLDIIIQSAEGNPRRINQLCIRLSSIMRMRGGTLTKDSLLEIVSEYFNIIDGMNSQEREYLSFMERVKSASLATITSSLGIGKETLQTEIEPQLLFKGKIKITSKGREYVDNN
jgi:Holliday junction resolvasome RuvABC ATP-dependent DNA helicase subunit